MKLSATRQVVRHQACGHHCCFSVALSTKLKVQICGRRDEEIWEPKTCGNVHGRAQNLKVSERSEGDFL